MHVVGGEAREQPAGQRVARQADLHADRLGALVKPVEMSIQERDAAGHHPKPLPDAVAENEAGVEDGDHRLFARQQLAVHRDENPGIAWVVGVFVGPGAHDASS
jgi:hypothetical protein